MNVLPVPLVLLIGSSCFAAPVPDPLAAEREAVWNSPEMLAARGYLFEYFAASKRHKDRDKRRYLERLSQATPDQMRTWLADLKRRRSSNLAHYQQREFERILAEEAQQSASPRVEEALRTTVAATPLALFPSKSSTQTTAPRDVKRQNDFDSDERGAELDYQEFLRTQCEKFHQLGLSCPKTVEELVRGPIVETTTPAEAVPAP